MVNGHEHRAPPFLWLGMGFAGWLRALARNRFAVAPRRVALAGLVAGLGPFHMVLRMLQRLCYGRALESSALNPEPLFVLGHWRSGTTLLHELLACDTRFAFPDTYACFCPDHFLVSRRVVVPWLAHFMPTRRTTDDVLSGLDSPQEDEFALCLLGMPSPYLSIAFPNQPPQCDAYVDLADLPAAAQQRWCRAFIGFLRGVSWPTGRPLLLKTPFHMARLPTLLQLFPAARFVHIVRDPREVFDSTLRLWKSLYVDHGLQTPNFRDLEERVLTMYEHLYTRFERDRGLIPPGRLVDLRFEDLVAGPVRSLATVYEGLQLGSPATAGPAVEAYLARRRNHTVAEHALTERQAADVTARWLPFTGRYGYNGDGPRG